MILGLGVDLAECARIRGSRQKHGQRFLDRVYTASEQAYCLSQKDPIPNLAARWAAKEACFKAMSAAWKGAWEPSQIEVARDEEGRVALRLLGKTRLPKRTTLHLSITHSKDHAVAVVVWEKN
jgi:holo-[acyl-carrier protein] synthase